jgi:hypothetical protein
MYLFHRESEGSMGVLLAVAFLAQASPAEETLRRIEETIDQAKSIQLKFTRTRVVKVLDHADSKIEQSGRVLIKDGNKVWAAISEDSTASQRVPKDLIRVISDGRKIICGSGMYVAPPGTLAPPSSLKPALGRSLTRSHVVTTLVHATFLRSLRPPKIQDMDIGERFKVSGVRAGEDDADARTLGYKVEIADTRTTYDVKLWYDPVSLKPLKRRMTTKTDFLEEVATDTYDELNLNVDIQEWNFALP